MSRAIYAIKKIMHATTVTKAKREKVSLRLGIEPRSPAWQAGILTTILSEKMYMLQKETNIKYRRYVLVWLDVLVTVNLFTFVCNFRKSYYIQSISPTMAMRVSSSIVDIHHLSFGRDLVFVWWRMTIGLAWLLTLSQLRNWASLSIGFKYFVLILSNRG